MKLINTDGMSFIGPGSEWFWTALSGIVLAVTFLAIYRQLRLQSSAIEQAAAFARGMAQSGPGQVHQWTTGAAVLRHCSEGSTAGR